MAARLGRLLEKVALELAVVPLVLGQVASDSFGLQGFNHDQSTCSESEGPASSSRHR